MNQEQLDNFKAELRRIIETRIERPIDQINTRLAYLEKKLKEHDQHFEQINRRFDAIDTKLKRHDDTSS